MAGGPINLDDMNKALNTMTEAREKDLNSKLSKADAGDMKEMLALQQDMQKWTLATNLQTNAMKTLSDGIKSTIQNIR